jgi:hypothetical protein
LTGNRHARFVPSDPLLDRFIPVHDVVERHEVLVKASSHVTFEAMCDVDLQRSALIRAIFRTRELMLGSEPDASDRPRGLLALTKSLGWGVLAEVPGREIVMGAVTQPWQANVVFRAIPPEEFARFDEPNFVKIVWTLRADPIDAEHAVARTETRVLATDPAARRRFRRYWRMVAPGILVIRRVALKLVRSEAERLQRQHGGRYDRHQDHVGMLQG